MVQGLKTEAQQKAAEAFVKPGVDAVVEYLSHPKQPKEFSNKAAYEKYIASAKSNAFYKEVEDLYNFYSIKTPDGKMTLDPDRKDEFEREIIALKESSVQTMINGDPPKQFGEILSGAFQNFDIMNPFSIIGVITGAIGVITGAIKEFAMSFGGDMAAPWLKAMKSKLGNTEFGKKFPKMFGSGPELTTEQAAESLAYQNAGMALAKAKGITDPNAQKAFAANAAAQMQAAAAEAANAVTGDDKPEGNTNPALSLQLAKLREFAGQHKGELFDAYMNFGTGLRDDARAALTDIVNGNSALKPLADQKIVQNNKSFIMVSDEEGNVAVYIGTQNTKGNATSFTVNQILKPDANGNFIPVSHADVSNHTFTLNDKQNLTPQDQQLLTKAIAGSKSVAAISMPRTVVSAGIGGASMNGGVQMPSVPDMPGAAIHMG